MPLDRKEKIEAAAKVFRISTDIAQAGTYIMHGKYRRGAKNMRAVMITLGDMATELERDIED